MTTGLALLPSTIWATEDGNGYYFSNSASYKRGFQLVLVQGAPFRLRRSQWPSLFTYVHVQWGESLRHLGEEVDQKHSTLNVGATTIKWDLMFVVVKLHCKSKTTSNIAFGHQWAANLWFKTSKRNAEHICFPLSNSLPQLSIII